MSRGLRSFKALALVALLMTGIGAAQGADRTANGDQFFEASGGVPPEVANTAAGDIYANVMGASINVQREFRRALPSIYSYSQTAHYQDRADAVVSSGDALAEVAAENYSAVCPTTMCAPGSRWVMWDVPFLMKDIQKYDDRYLGYEQNVSGFATGISRMLGESSAIGLAVGYDQRRMKDRDEFNYLHMKNNADTFHAALFGGTNVGNFFIDGYAGYSRSWNRSEHDIHDFAGSNTQTNKANYTDTILSAGAKVSYVWILPSDMRITPSVGVDFSHITVDSFDERTYGQQFRTVSGRKSSYSGVAVPVMMTMNKTFASSFLAFGGYDSLWTPEVRGGYVGQFGGKRAGIDMRENNTFGRYTVKSSKLAGSYGTVGGGLKIKLRNKYIFGVDYDYLFGDSYANHSLTAMYGVSF